MRGRALFSLGNEYIAYLFDVQYLGIIVYRLFDRKASKGNKNDLFVNTICGAVVGFTIILIAISLYLQWTSTYSNIINGIQGRYFIALLLPLYFTIHKVSAIMDDHSTLTVYELSFIVLINICDCIAVLFSCMRL